MTKDTKKTDAKLVAINKATDALVTMFAGATDTPVKKLAASRRALNKSLMDIGKQRRMPTREVLEARIAKMQAQLAKVNK